MKLFKRFALLIVVALSIVCMGAFAAACDNTKAATEYSVTVCYSDGTTTVDGTKADYRVQICDASGVFCYPTFVKLDANGKASFKMTDVDAAADSANVTEKAYVLHVWDFSDQDNPVTLEFKNEITVSKDSASTTAVLKNIEAPAK